MHALKTDVTPAAPNWRQVSEIADLAEIFEPGVQVCSLVRRVDPRITTYLEGATGSAFGQSVETFAPFERASLVGLPPGDGRDVLLDDVAWVAEILHQLVDCPIVGLRCTRVEHAMCPRWHVDRVPLRMLCTYEGPGTEWLDNQGVDRAHLASLEMADGACQRAGAGDLVLLKGALWQDNAGLGAVHRSPAVQPGTGQRTLITLDPVWPD